MDQQKQKNTAVHYPKHYLPKPKFNERVARRITSLVGSMGCAYIFIALTLPALPQVIHSVHHGDFVAGVNWLTQSFIQLVLLPIILVNDHIEMRDRGAKAQADHEAFTHLANMVDKIADHLGIDNNFKY